jgi:hypothetical protein
MAYHYLANLRWYESCRHRCSTDMRMPCKIIDHYFDCRFDLVGRVMLMPGESGEVRLTFLSIDLVASLIQVGGHYEIYEGSRPIGEIFIISDPWIDLRASISEGEVRQAKIAWVNWTIAGIILEGEMPTELEFEDVGLMEWEEIGQVLNRGDIVKVRIEKVDEVNRKIKVSLVEKVLCDSSSRLPHHNNPDAADTQD